MKLRSQLLSGFAVVSGLMILTVALSYQSSRLGELAVIAGEGLALVLAAAVMSYLTRQVFRQIGGEPAEIAADLARIARGDLEIDRPGEDGIAASVGVISSTLKEVARQTNAIARGDYSADIAPRSAKDELGIALQAMTAALRSAHQTSTERDWLKTGLARLGDAVSGDPVIETLAAKGISEIATYLEAQLGALYLVGDGDRPSLVLRGSYAYSRRKNLSNEFVFGEGLVGQAALERKQILIRNVPDDYVRVVSGLGEGLPRFICVTPFLYESRLKGVVEIGTLGQITPTQMDYLNQAMPLLAIAVESAQARSVQAALLEESRRLGQELQAQQEELRTINEELEQQSRQLKSSEERLRVQQEELEVTNNELEEKNERLERQKQEVEQARQVISVKADELALASRYKSEFLANMSHELRTPLNSLLLLAQSLTQNRGGNLTAEQIEAARIIHSSGSDLLNLINEILDLSKIEAGRMDLQVSAVSVADLAEGLRASFAHMAQAKGLKFEVAVAADAPAEVGSDYKRLEQVLRNLISNAVKFTETGGITVTFGRPAAGTSLSRSALAADNCLAIAVRDTGIGIPDDKHKLIFEAFQQADGGTARRYGGTGLGLTISRELASLLGGEIQLASEPGKGSTFTLYLPVAGGVRPAPSVRAAASQDVAPPPSVRRRPVASVNLPAYIADDRDQLAEGDRVIVVIEDDPHFATILLGKCHEKGFKCLAAASGEVGLQLVDTHLPSAVILDIGLPGMDGMKVLSALKEDIHTRHIPVHMISVEETRAESLGKGAVGHAVKPLDQERLDGVFHRLEEVAAIKPRRILVVEDDAAARRTTIELLADQDVAVDEAGTGEDAIRLLHEERYDCIVLDLKLPDMDGRELLDRLAREGVALPPVVVHTARDLSAREEMDLRGRAESIVIKDVRSPERLLDEVSLFLHRVVSQMPEGKRKIIGDLHDPDSLLRDRKVLIVDDDMRTMFAVSRLLAERGMRPIKAENGEQALRLLNERPDVDLVLMDVMMPVMDGYEAMKRIREQERYRRLPIIALTAKAMPEDRQKCIAAGASDYLSKPIDADRLFSMMRVWLHG